MAGRSGTVCVYELALNVRARIGLPLEGLGARLASYRSADSINRGAEFCGCPAIERPSEILLFAASRWTLPQYFFFTCKNTRISAW